MYVSFSFRADSADTQVGDEKKGKQKIGCASLHVVGFYLPLNPNIP